MIRDDYVSLCFFMLCVFIWDFTHGRSHPIKSYWDCLNTVCFIFWKIRQNDFLGKTDDTKPRDHEILMVECREGGQNALAR